MGQEKVTLKHVVARPITAKKVATDAKKAAERAAKKAAADAKKAAADAKKAAANVKNAASDAEQESLNQFNTLVECAATKAAAQEAAAISAADARMKKIRDTVAAFAAARIAAAAAQDVVAVAARDVIAAVRSAADVRDIITWVNETTGFVNLQVPSFVVGYLMTGISPGDTDMETVRKALNTGVSILSSPNIPYVRFCGSVNNVVVLRENCTWLKLMIF